MSAAYRVVGTNALRGAVGAVSVQPTASSSHPAAKVKMQELFEYWLACDAGRNAVQQLVDETVKSSRAADVASAMRTAKLSTSGSSEPSSNLPTRAAQAEERADDDDDGPREASPNAKIDSSSSTHAAVAVSLEDIPLDLGGFQLGRQPRSTSQQIVAPRDGMTGLQVTSAPPAALIAREHPPLAANHLTPDGSRSPGARHQLLLSPGRQRQTGAVSPRLGANVSHAVDEMDVAHRLGALSPRTAAIRSPTSSGLMPPKSPLEQPVSQMASIPFSLDANGSTAAAATSAGGGWPPSTTSSGATVVAPLSKPGGGGSTSAMEAHGVMSAFRPSASRSPSPPNAVASDSLSDAEDSVSSLPLSGSSAAAVKPVPVATMEQLPQFYFKRGRPVYLPSTVFATVAVAPSGGPPVSTRGPATPSPLQATTLMAQQKEDQELSQLGRIFAQFVAAQQAAAAAKAGGSKASGAKRSGGATNGRPTTSSAAGGMTQRQAAGRIVNEVFGLPGVFVKLIADRFVNLEGGFTLQSVRTYYEKFMAKVTPERRMFEALLGCGKQPSSSVAAGGQPPRDYLTRQDFVPFVETLLDSHPGLAFLKETDFQAKYLEVVVIRIFFELDSRDVGRITYEQFARSQLPAAIRQVDATEDINSVLAFFSYEHFYVVYCRFWELDDDRDMLLSPADLAKYYPDDSANPVIIARIFCGTGRRLSCKTKDRLNFEDFCWFCMCEENKSHPRAIQYWFRLLDLDGDGYISGYELQSFYAATRAKMLTIMSEAIAYDDVMSQVMDMLSCGAAHGAPPASSGASTSSGRSSGAKPAATSHFTTLGSAIAGWRDASGLLRAAPPPGNKPPAAAAASASTTSTRPPRGGGLASSAPSAAAGPSSGGAGPHYLLSLNLMRALGGSHIAAGVWTKSCFSINDFQRCPVAAFVAFNMLTNVTKFLIFEQRDPFVQQATATGGPERNEWDRFCRAEYDRMAADTAEDAGAQ